MVNFKHVHMSPPCTLPKKVCMHSSAAVAGSVLAFEPEEEWFYIKYEDSYE